MELRDALAICEECSTLLEHIPEDRFYPPIQLPLSEALIQLDEMIGALSRAVDEQDRLAKLSSP